MSEPEKKPKPRTLSDEDITSSRAKPRPASLNDVGAASGAVKQISNDPLQPGARPAGGSDPDA